MNRIKLLGFGEPMLFGSIAMGKDGISVGPVSEREIQRVQQIGIKYELIPIECEHCAAHRREVSRLTTQCKQLTDKVVELSDEIVGLRKRPRH